MSLAEGKEGYFSSLLNKYKLLKEFQGLGLAQKLADQACCVISHDDALMTLDHYLESGRPVYLAMPSGDVVFLKAKQIAMGNDIRNKLLWGTWDGYCCDFRKFPLSSSPRPCHKSGMKQYAIRPYRHGRLHA